MALKKNTKKKTTPRASSKKTKKAPSPSRKKPALKKKGNLPAKGTKPAPAPPQQPIESFSGEILECLKESDSKQLFQRLSTLVTGALEATAINLYRTPEKKTDGLRLLAIAANGEGRLYAASDEIPELKKIGSEVRNEGGRLEELSIPCYRIDDGGAPQPFDEARYGIALPVHGFGQKGLLTILTPKKVLEKEKKVLLDFLFPYARVLRGIAEEETVATQEEERKAESLRLSEAHAALNEEKKKNGELLAQLKSKESVIERGAQEYETKLNAQQQANRKAAEQIEKREAKISELTAELEKQTRHFTEQLEAQKEENGNIATELRELRNRSEQSEKIIADSKKNETSLNETVRRLNSELETAAEKLSRVQENLKEGFQKEKEALRLEVETATEREKELKQKIETLNGEMRQERSAFDSEGKGHLEKIASLEKRLTEEQNNVEALHDKLRRKSEELSATATEQEARVRQITESLETRIRETEQTGESRLQEITASFETRIEELTNSFEQKIGQLEAEKGAVTAELESNKNELNGAKEAFRLELERQQEQHNRTLDEKAALIEQKESAIHDLEHQVKSLQGDAANLNRTIGELNGKIDDASRRESALKSEIHELEQMQELLNGEIAQQKAKLDESSATIQRLVDSEKQLNTEIGSHRENIRLLEGTIRNLESEKLAQGSTITNLNDQIKELQQEIIDSNEKINQKKHEITELQNREKKLTEELRAAIEREEGSREEGKLVGDIIHSVSEEADPHPMLRLLKERIAFRCPVDRISLFGMKNENELVYEGGISGEDDLTLLQNRSVPLNKTVFGQAFAEHASFVIENPKIDDADLPFADPEAERIRKAIPAKSILLLPLSHQNRTLGIMVLSAKQQGVFNATNTALFNALIPFFSRVIAYNQEQDRIAEQNALFTHHKMKFSFIESRYIRLSKQTGSEGDESLFSLIPRSMQTADELLRWIDTATQSVQARSPMKVSVEIDRKAVEAIQKRCGTEFENIFWFVAEAIENSIRHSEATELSIVAHREESTPFLSIADNGEGLLRTIGTEEPTNGIGFGAMKSLIAAANGTLFSGKNEDGTGLKLVATWDKGR